MARQSSLLNLTIFLLLIGSEAVLGAVVPVSEALSSSVDRNKACNLIFNIERTADGQSVVSSISMPPLEQMMSARDQPLDNVCNIVFALQPTIALGGASEKPGVQRPVVMSTSTTTTTKSPKKPMSTTTATTTTTTRRPWSTTTGRPWSTTTRRPWSTTTGRPWSTTKRPHPTTKWPLTTTRKPSTTTTGSPIVQQDSTQPLYELQLAVWPSDVEDFVDALPEDVIGEEEIFQPADEDRPSTVGSAAPVLPVYEDQLTVFPDLGEGTQKPVSSTEHPIVVVQNTHQKHANGTLESKLVLSNGVVNYKKVYKKMKDGVNVTVQEGYDTMPIPGKQDKYQTQYYVSDNKGHHVYKVEQTIDNPGMTGGQ